MRNSKSARWNRRWGKYEQKRVALQRLTVKALRDLAQEVGMDIPTRILKADLVKIVAPYVPLDTVTALV